MSEQSEAERFLLERIRGGDAGAWAQLLRRYQGRLLAFARGRGVKAADAEDFVQDTFLLFLRALPDFRAQASLETYLFVILRRRISDHFRGRGHKDRAAQSLDARDSSSTGLAAADPTASWYVRRDEHRDAARAALCAAVRGLAARMQAELNFRDLQIVEALFHAQLRNKEAAALCGVEEPFIALVKHRWLKQVREQVAHAALPEATEKGDALDSLLTEIWEDLRPACPKRSTIGSFLLGSLDAPWQAYVDAHVHRLGCTFCQANLNDLQEQTADKAAPLRERFFQSTVGFLRKA
ncbi:MAG TPA: RNA polymerase sigma factor [Tepidisphaeraceae bacterium]|nr:RNA polymerase sigma factor [Tepidisphaeraceae bacterium]